MDIAERYGLDLRRLLRSAERLRLNAIARGLRFLKTLASRSSALLSRVTREDQRLPPFARFDRLVRARAMRSQCAFDHLSLPAHPLGEKVALKRRRATCICNGGRSHIHDAATSPHHDDLRWNGDEQDDAQPRVDKPRPGRADLPRAFR